MSGEMVINAKNAIFSKKTAFFNRAQERDYA